MYPCIFRNCFAELKVMETIQFWYFKSMEKVLNKNILEYSTHIHREREKQADMNH